MPFASIYSWGSGVKAEVWYVPRKALKLRHAGAHDYPSLVGLLFGFDFAEPGMLLCGLLGRNEFGKYGILQVSFLALRSLGRHLFD